MEEDFVFLPFFFYFFTWMAVAHIHTSNTKRSFHEISRLYDNKYNTSNYYVDAYVKTHFAETTTTTKFVTAEAATFIKAFEQQPLFSLILFLYSLSIETHPHLLSCMFSFSLKLKTHHLLLCTMWPNNFIEYI